MCNPYVLARHRTTSTDAPRNPTKLAPSQQKDQKNQTNPEKRKKSLLDPGRHFPVPYFVIPPFRFASMQWRSAVGELNAALEQSKTSREQRFAQLDSFTACSFAVRLRSSSYCSAPRHSRRAAGAEHRDNRKPSEQIDDAQRTCFAPNSACGDGRESGDSDKLLPSRSVASRSLRAPTGAYAMAYASARCSTGPASSRCLWCAPCCDVASSDRSTTFCPEAEDDSIADLRRCMASLDHAMGAFKSESTSRSGVPSLARCTYSCSRLPQALALISFDTRTHCSARTRTLTDARTRRRRRAHA